MSKKKQNIILNTLMVAAIALTVFSGIMIAGSLQRTEAVGTPAPTLNISALNGTENQTNDISGESGITISDPMTVTVVDVNDDDEADNTSDSDVESCTITIVCDTILGNLDKLKDGKEAFVPSNGVILDVSTVQLKNGDTVFDVLQRVCSLANIQLEYSYSAYESYYIEGINNLYEFDCGTQSGWMYKVNEVFPNFGCSACYLSDGDEIVFCYTCEGNGADVGGSMY